MLAIHPGDEERRTVVQDEMPEHPGSGPNICAVLISFHPDSGLRARAHAILEQVGALVIVDNGSDDASARMLEELAHEPRISLELNGANLGIARALNIGIARARGLGYEWVLLLDQDSVLDEGMVEELIAVHRLIPEPGRLAVLGAGFRDIHKPEAASADPGVRWEEVESVITSGSLLRCAELDRLGGFREEFFIDYVDSEFCFRARARGYRVARTRRSLMSPAIGASTHHLILGVGKWTSNHSADRRYYMARNDTVMLKEYGGFRWGSWALKSFGRRVRTCKRIALYEDGKLGKIAAVAGGWWDGVRGKLGPRG
jgi:rhamnosyltransferase